MTLATEHRGVARRSHADRRCFDHGAQLVTWFASCGTRGFARRLDVDRRWSGTVLRRLRGSVVILCMYVCMYLFTYVSSYVAVCLCIYVCTQARYLFESVCIPGCMHVLMHVCMYVSLYAAVSWCTYLAFTCDDAGHGPGIMLSLSFDVRFV